MAEIRARFYSKRHTERNVERAAQWENDGARGLLAGGARPPAEAGPGPKLGGQKGQVP